MNCDLAILRELIRRYQTELSARVSRLRETLGRDDLLRGWRESVYPQEGTFGIDDAEYYSFHGTGCSIEDDAIAVDFEFGAGGRIGGFDAWRLHLFAENFEDEYPEFKDSKIIESGIDQLIESGELARPNELPNRSLVYTTELFKRMTKPS